MSAIAAMKHTFTLPHTHIFIECVGTFLIYFSEAILGLQEIKKIIQP